MSLARPEAEFVVDLDRLRSSARPIVEAETLPSDYYTDPAAFEIEKEHIFAREWMCVGRAEEVPEVGDYKTVTLLDEPLIVVRDKDGEVRAMSAVCRHRGMVITDPADGEFGDWEKDPTESSGSCRNFRCPFHFWTYGLDGSLLSAPEMGRTQDFDKSEHGLVQIRAEVWQGFVFVNLDPDAASLVERMGPVDELLANWGLGSMKGGVPAVTSLPSNWKIIQEGSESYHLDRLHNPLHKVMPSGGYQYEGCDIEDDPPAIPFWIRAAHPDYGLNPTGEALLPPIEALTEKERQDSLWVMVPPNLLIGAQCDSAFYRIIMPRAVDRSESHQSYLVPESSHAMTNFREILDMQESFHLRLNHQDYMVVAGIQRGLRSRYAPRGRYSWQEEVLSHFNRWLVHRYAGATQEDDR